MNTSVKRACVNIGIGRELYTSPFIWVPADKCTITNGKCYDKFSVADIGYNEEREIVKLTIINAQTGKTVYAYSSGKSPLPAHASTTTEDIAAKCEVCGGTITPYTYEGKEISVRQQLIGTKKNMGKVMCHNCYVNSRMGYKN